MNKQFLLQNDLENTRSILALAEAQLREILDKLQGNIPPESIKSTSELDKLFNFSTQYEAKILTLKTVGSGDELRQPMIDLVESNLGETILLQDFLSGKDKITEDNFKEISNLKLLRANIIDRINQASRIAVAGDVKITEAKNYSIDKLLRQVTRSVAIDADFDREVSSFLMSLVYETHKDEQVLPLILKELDKNDIYAQSFNVANSQVFRDRVGGSIVALIKQAVSQKPIGLFDQSFRSAYHSVVNFLVGIYTEVLNTSPDLRRTPEEVEEIKRELLSDIEMPVAPIAPAPLAAPNAPADDLRSSIPASSGVRDDKEAAPAASAKTIPSAPLPPTPKPQVAPATSSAPDASNGSNVSRSPIGSIAFPVRDDKDTDLTSATPNTSIAPNAPTAPVVASQNKGNITVNKIERPTPQKDKLNPIQRIDLE